MASFLHASACTTARLRAKFKASQESTRALARRYGVNPKPSPSGARDIPHDARMRPKNPRSTVLTAAKEAIIVAFWQKTLLALDDVMGCLKDTIPNLSRSALHRCVQRNTISRLPAAQAAETRRRFKAYEIGYVHIDSCGPPSREKQATSDDCPEANQ